MSVALGDAISLTRALVQCDSRNPSLVPDGPGEAACAQVLHRFFDDCGVPVQLLESAPGRPNVVAIIRGRGRGRSLMFNGHIDVVGVDGMTHPPFDALEKAGRLYGRGASDMKGGVAAMCAAAARLTGQLAGDLIVTAVVDEEWKSLGTESIIASGLRADAAIVTEPTGLAVMPAHRGFVWIEIVCRGRAAHGSRWDIGIDAIRHAGLLLAELDSVDRDELPARSHSLLGRPSLHAATIAGGTGLSTYPDRCTLEVERRTIPGETVAEVRAQFHRACERVRERVPEFDADVTVLFSQPPSDVRVDAPIVRSLERALRERDLPVQVAGMSAWTDAALLNGAGIPAICFGPGDMGLAHAAEEFIEVDQIEQATDVLVALAKEWCC